MTSTEPTTPEYGWAFVPGGYDGPVKYISDADYGDPERIKARYEEIAENARRIVAELPERQRRTEAFRRKHGLPDYGF